MEISIKNFLISSQPFEIVNKQSYVFGNIGAVFILFNILLIEDAFITIGDFKNVCKADDLYEDIKAKRYNVRFIAFCPIVNPDIREKVRIIIQQYIMGKDILQIKNTL